MQIAELIEEHAPCAGGVKWLKKHGIKTVAEAYDRCERSDWLIWLLVEVHGIDRRQRVTLSCQIVRTIWHLLSEDDKSCIMTCEKWLAGEATDKELLAARDTSAAAHACADAAAASCTADACADASASASYASASYASASYAADAAASSAACADACAASSAACADACADASASASYASASASAAQHAKQCEIIREMFPNPF